MGRFTLLEIVINNKEDGAPVTPTLMPARNLDYDPYQRKKL